jgi:hypothetical protein
MTKRKKTYREIEGVEFGVDSRYTSKKESVSDSKALMEARSRRMNNVSADQMAQARLLQLKLNMEEYIKAPVYGAHNYFIDFLTTYIDTIYKRRGNFAKDIDITPIRLSQVLNNHRDPKEEFMLRLMIHSEKTYENVCQFNKKTWYQVYFHEKICDTMSNQDAWRPSVEKHITMSKLIRA